MEKNIILFPRTIDQHLERGFEKIKKGHYDDAIEHFYAVIHYEPSHREAQLAIAVCLIELNRYEEVIPITSSLLRAGDDSYFEILRLHIDALLNTEQIEEAQIFLEALMDEENIPDSFIGQHEKLKELQDQHDAKEYALQSKLDDDPNYKKKLMQMLKDGTVEEKQSAIEQTMVLVDDDLEKGLRDFLLEENDPVSKTFALQAIRLMKATGSATVRKDDQTSQINLIDVPISSEDWRLIGESVYDQLIKNTESEGPSLTQFAIQLWMEYLYICFPHLPSFDNPEKWAAAIHFIILDKLGMNSDGVITEQYSLTLEELNDQLKLVERTLQSRHMRGN